MKCLLCKFNTNDKNELKSHYLKYHNVDENNLFFKKLIDQRNNVIHGRKIATSLPKKFEITFKKHSSSYDFLECC